MSEPEPEMALVRAALRTRRFTLTTERALQDGIEIVLSEQGFRFEREARLSARDRIDFIVQRSGSWGGPALGVEVKIDDSISALLRQLMRYASLDRIGALLVVTTRNRLANLPAEMNGKPLRALVLLGSML